MSTASPGHVNSVHRGRTGRALLLGRAAVQYEMGFDRAVRLAPSGKMHIHLRATARCKIGAEL